MFYYATLLGTLLCSLLCSLSLATGIKRSCCFPNTRSEMRVSYSANDDGWVNIKQTDFSFDYENQIEIKYDHKTTIKEYRIYNLGINYNIWYGVCYLRHDIKGKTMEKQCDPCKYKKGEMGHTGAYPNLVNHTIYRHNAQGTHRSVKTTHINGSQVILKYSSYEGSSPEIYSVKKMDILNIITPADMEVFKIPADCDNPYNLPQKKKSPPRTWDSLRR